MLTINIQRLLCTVIKFHVVNEAVLYLFSARLLGELLTAKFISVNRLQYVFQGRNPILLLLIQSGVRLTEVFNNRN